jgi:hypothetical protein
MCQRLEKQWLNKRSIFRWLVAGINPSAFFSLQVWETAPTGFARLRNDFFLSQNKFSEMPKINCSRVAKRRHDSCTFKN